MGCMTHLANRTLHLLVAPALNVISQDDRHSVAVIGERYVRLLHQVVARGGR